MSHLDDLPRRHSSHHIEDRSKTAFRVAISECHDFIIQSDDRDYGTDFVIEAIDAGKPTNVRVHVQVKGTNCNAREDGSIGVSVARSNVNYHLMQPGSVFVCYHIPTERLLVRRADDIAREYEHGGKDWHGQQTVTVRFEEAFDRDFQRSLKEYVVASAKGERDRRLNLAIHPPSTLSIVREEGAIDLPVPADPTQARRVLVELYESGQNKAISLSFDKFHAVLGSSDQVFLRAYMAEINLGINGPAFDGPRIREGIDALLSAIDDDQHYPGAILYSRLFTCRGGWARGGGRIMGRVGGPSHHRRWDERGLREWNSEDVEDGRGRSPSAKADVPPTGRGDPLDHSSHDDLVGRGSHRYCC